jgi:hypothetical protein
VAALSADAYAGDVKLRPLALLAVLGMTACHAEPGETPVGDESSGTTAEPEPAPAFLNPALGGFRIGADQLEPEQLVVQNVEPGLTQVLIDDLASPGFGPDSPFGALTADSLTLVVRGALVAGEHTLQLLTPSKDGPRYSVRLTMQITAPLPTLRPTFAASLDPAPIATGTALIASGGSTGSLLGLLGPGDPDPELRLFRAGPDGWSTTDPIVVPLEGHVPEAMSLTPAISAIAVPEPDGSPPRRMRVAHTVGLPATAIATRDVALNPDPIVLDPVIAFDLPAALAGTPVEWAAFGRPALLGHTLLAELTAAADAELAHPGDRRLVASFWRGEALSWAPPQRIGTAIPTDLDSLGAATVLWDISATSSPSLSLRLGGAFPAVLTVSDNGAISITTPPMNVPLDVRGEIALTTMLSDFGSRTVAAVDPRGRVSLSVLDTSRGNKGRRISPKSAELADAAVTGPLAAGVGRGFPFFLVPHGDAAPVAVVASDGEVSFVQTIADLHCDALALAVTLAGNDPELAAVPLACLLDGELRLGHVTIVAPE